LVVALLGVGTAAARLHGSRPPTAAPSDLTAAPPVATSASEIGLIAAAQRALAAGDSVKARAALREHAERFPEGQMKVQRRLLEAYTERIETQAP
jgi:hypothetical protein